jgi:hypothetical protein
MPVSTNIDALINNLEAKLNDATKQFIALEVASALLGPVKARIHNDGLAGDGSEIGTYSNAYLKERQRKYNRTADSKVVLSLTRQMENDFTVQAVGNNSYGLGYNNAENYKKAVWNDNRFGHTVYALTKEEEQIASEIAKDALINALTK